MSMASCTSPPASTRILPASRLTSVAEGRDVEFSDDLGGARRVHAGESVAGHGVPPVPGKRIYCNVRSEQVDRDAAYRRVTRGTACSGGTSMTPPTGRRPVFDL